MAELAHWEFATNFTAAEAAALIIGVDPATASKEDLARTSPVLARMADCYRMAVLSSLSMLNRSEEETADSVFPPGALVSITMDRLVRAALEETAETSLNDWLEGPDAAFDEQQFSRGALYSWLRETGRGSVYIFYRPPPSPTSAATITAAADGLVGVRERSTYLNIIGGLIDLMLDPGPNGRPRSGYADQNAIIEGLLAHFPRTPGLSKRNLEAKFANARRSIKAL